MSKRNGDRARFGKERQKKMLRRARTEALRKAMDGKSAEPEAARTSEVGTTSGPAD